MPHWKSMMDRDLLFAFDLAGQDKTLTIDRVAGGELTGPGGKKSKKPLCHFRNVPKPLGLNATNCKTIAALYGNDTDEWAGKRITLFPTTTQMGGETVECIRVRPRVPPAAAARAGRPAPDETAPEASDAGDPEPPEPGSGG